MKYESASFNEKWVLKFTKQQFVNHVSNRHLWPKISQELRKKRLGELYDLVKAKNK